MIKQQRQDEIMRLLQENDTMLVSVLAETLGCSMMTIRRDIDELSKQSLVKKIHGGAMMHKQDVVQPSFDRRIVQNTSEKERIGRKVASMIENGSSVFFDAGTTPLNVAKAIPASVSITAITNSIMTAAELCTKPNINVIMVGGELHHSSFSAVNNIAMETAERFTTDLAIISTKAIYANTGLYETYLPLIEIKKTIAKRAEKVILVADYSKFDEHAMCLSVSIDDIDVVVTDDKTSEENIDILQNAGKEVIVV